MSTSAGPDTYVIPVGSVSTTDQPDESDGPLLVSWIVYVKFCPAVAVSPLSILSIDRSALRPTGVSSVSVSFSESGSGSWPTTVTMLVNVLSAATLDDTSTVMLNVRKSPAAMSVSLLSVTVPSPLSTARMSPLLADTNVIPAGSVSVTVQPEESDGPALLIVTVYVNSSPAVAVASSSVLMIDRSAIRTVVTLAVALTGSVSALSAVAVFRLCTGVHAAVAV